MDLTVYDALRNIVYTQSGIRLQDGKEAMLSGRIASRLHALGLPDERAYLAYLQRELDQEIVPLLDVISTNVTNFYRDAEHFDYITQWMGDWLAAGQERFRVWCAASSTGEEPYTLAMTLSEAVDRAGVQANARILASDISTRVLRKAQEGVYEAKRIEPVPEPLLSRYFDSTNTGSGFVYRAKDSLRDMIRFKRLNLSTPPFPMRGPMDIIVCRNVMTYFDEPVRAALIHAFHGLLRPGGYLITGKFEGLRLAGMPFDPAGPSIYRKSA